MQIYDSAAQIQMFRMRALKGALKLEILGMRKKGRSAYSSTTTFNGSAARTIRIKDRGNRYS